jgi:hypothetical protein
MARISLEVSIGEALDKYSILCIKEEHIVDTFKKKAIQLEKETIYPSIEPIYIPVNNYMNNSIM